MCEVLRRHPHPNIASRGEWSSYWSLLQTIQGTSSGNLNPRYLNKNQFLASGREQVDDSLRENYSGIFEGIKHLHPLGLVHNDINPSNTMLDEHGIPMIIDFGS